MKRDYRAKECQSIATHGSVPLGHLAARTLGGGGCVLGNLAAANAPYYRRPAIPLNSYDAKQLRRTGEAVNYGTFTLSYGYDYYANGQKKSFTGPDGTTVHYSYDSNNQLANIQIPAGNITINSYRLSSPSQITLPGGSVRVQNHDALLRLTQIQIKAPGQNELMNYQYGQSRHPLIRNTARRSRRGVRSRMSYSGFQTRYR